MLITNICRVPSEGSRPGIAAFVVPGNRPRLADVAEEMCHGAAGQLCDLEVPVTGRLGRNGEHEGDEYGGGPHMVQRAGAAMSARDDTIVPPPRRRLPRLWTRVLIVAAAQSLHTDRARPALRV